MPGREEPAPERIDPRTGVAYAARLQAGLARRFAFDLAEGEYLDLAISQEEADLVATLFAPGGGEGLRIDTVTPVAERVPERVRFVAAETGLHVLKVAAGSSGSKGRFRLSVRALRRATLTDRAAARAAVRLATAERLRRFRDRANEERALPLYAEAARRFSALGDRGGEAYARIQRGRVLVRVGYAEEAEREVRRALEVSSIESEPAWRAVAATELARLLSSGGRNEEARTLLEEALPLWRRLGVVSRIAQVENELALRAQERGELAEAERLFLSSIAHREQEGNDYEVALALGNLATVYGSANENRLALDTALRALQRLPLGTSPADRAWFLSNRGEALTRLRRFDEAQGALLEARASLVGAGDATGDPGEVAQIDRRLARLAHQLGRTEEAVVHYRKALAGFEAAHDLPGAVATAQDLAWAELHRGHLREAERLFRSVPSRAREIGDRWTEAAAQLGLARIERANRRPEAALARAREALEIVETLRHRAGRGDLGSSVFADRQSFFDLAAQLLVERHEATGEPAFAEEAFDIAERSRARRLLDLVAADGPERAAGMPRPDSSGASRAVGEAEKTLRRLRALGASEERVAAAEAELRQALADLRRAAPWAAGDLAAAPLSLAEIRRRLDGRTALLEFDLGDESSSLWVVTRERLDRFPLPDRGRVEERVALALEVLSSPGALADGVTSQKVLTETTAILFGAALPSLRRPRWLIVADGALQALPLGALPDPAHPGQPFLAGREVVYAPSASVAVRLAERGRRAPGGGPLLAAFADPAYGPADPRLAARPSAKADPPEGEADPERGLDLSRLVASGGEARRILDLVPASRRLEALGPDAAKERILSGELASVRLLHFAVHGRPSLDLPELSSLEFSRFRRDGRPMDGTLHAYEIARLRLRADLAVLSACESAQGARIAGEGLVGLAHAFLAAGAARVVASHWPVEDQATAELMARFYDGLLRRRLSPSRALQQAQLSIAADPRWRRPYYWAGFSVQGGF